MFSKKEKIEALEKELQRLHREMQKDRERINHLSMELRIAARDIRYLIQIVENFFPRPRYPKTTGISARAS